LLLQDINELAAAAVRARLTGNMDLFNELNSKLERARAHASLGLSVAAPRKVEKIALPDIGASFRNSVFRRSPAPIFNLLDASGRSRHATVDKHEHDDNHHKVLFLSLSELPRILISLLRRVVRKSWILTRRANARNITKTTILNLTSFSAGRYDVVILFTGFD